MKIYYILLLVLMLLGWICFKLEKRYRSSTNLIRNFFLLISLILLSAVEGLRGYTVGSDTIAYTTMFSVSHISEHMEIGFRMFIDFLHLFTHNPTVYLIACALLANGLVISAIKKLSINPYLSIYFYMTLYYYFGSFNGIRQYIAIGFLLHAFIYAIRGNWFKYTLALAAAYLFHKTALTGLFFLYFAIPLDELSHLIKQMNPRIIEFLSITTMIGCALVICYLFYPLLNMSFDLFGSYQSYQTMDLTRTGGIQQVVVYGSIFFSVYFLVPQKDPMRKPFLFVMLCAFIYSLIQLRLFLIGRFVWYFDIFSIFVLPYLFAHNRLIKSNQNIFRISVMAASFLFMTYYLYVNYQKVGLYYFH